MAIIGIVAIAKNFAIGRGGKLPWHYPADLKFFKETTRGNAVVMGSNTWRSIRKPLPDRLNVILSRSENVDAPPEVMKLQTTEEVIELSKLLVKDVFIIGGAKTYAGFADAIDKWIVTHIPVQVDGADTFFLPDLLGDFEATKTIDLGMGVSVEFLHRKRI